MAWSLEQRQKAWSLEQRQKLDELVGVERVLVSPTAIASPRSGAASAARSAAAERTGMLRMVARIVLLVVPLLLLAGCVRSAAGAAAPSSNPASSAVAVRDGQPSAAARMICSQDAQDEIEAAIGAVTTQPVAGTWANRLYACRYVYQDQTMVLSVKDLPDSAATAAYFGSLRGAARGPSRVEGLGDAAFVGVDGSTVVRKDFKVLRVDVSGLREPFGPSYLPRAEVAFRVAAAIMACWTGS